MSSIRPISLPSGAGVSFGQGDVRHFSEDDAVDVPGMQTPTRHLAERDNLLAATLNEVVSAVNNREQFVPLMVPRTVLTPGTEEVVLNFRIPAGFEARVLNASVGSAPAASGVALRVLFAPGFGGTSGTEIVSTSAFFDAGVSFSNQGEFIVVLRNSSNQVLEMVGSLTLTVRPLGDTAGLLVGSVIQGEPGLPGRDGKGDKGEPGTGSPGAPGLVWRGAFNGASSYAPPEAVSFTDTGVTQSYVSKVNNPGPGSVPPPNTAYWDLLVSAQGVAGAALRWRGPWNGVTTYGSGTSYIDLVSRVSGNATSSYICKVTASLNKDPLAVPADWDVMAGPGGGQTPTYGMRTLTGTGGGAPVAPYVSTGANYVSGATSGDYTGGGAATTNIASSATECTILNSTASPQGMAFLHASARVVFTGSLVLHLPTTASGGATINWTTGNTRCIATVDSQGNDVTQLDLARVTAISTSAFGVVVATGSPQKVAISLFGAATVP